MGNVLNGIPKDHRAPILHEVHRVMDGTGPLIIDTDTATETYEDDFFDDINHKIEQAGFEITESIDEQSNPERYTKLCTQWPSDEWPDGHTFLVAQKKADTGSKINEASL